MPSLISFFLLGFGLLADVYGVGAALVVVAVVFMVMMPG